MLRNIKSDASGCKMNHVQSWPLHHLAKGTKGTGFLRVGIWYWPSADGGERVSIRNKACSEWLTGAGSASQSCCWKLSRGTGQPHCAGWHSWRGHKSSQTAPAAHQTCSRTRQWPPWSPCCTRRRTRARERGRGYQESTGGEAVPSFSSHLTTDPIQIPPQHRRILHPHTNPFS